MLHDPGATLDPPFLSLPSSSPFSLSLLRTSRAFSSLLHLHFTIPLLPSQPSGCSVAAAFSREINLALLKWSLLDLSYDLRHSPSSSCLLTVLNFGRQGLATSSRIPPSSCRKVRVRFYIGGGGVTRSNFKLSFSSSREESRSSFFLTFLRFCA